MSSTVAAGNTIVRYRPGWRVQIINSSCGRAAFTVRNLHGSFIDGYGARLPAEPYRIPESL